MTSPHQHQSIRKRITLNHPYPSRKKFIRWFDRFIMVAGALSVIATIPQVIEIWVHKSADGVSSISWAYYVFYSLAFTVYGFIHREFPIIFNYTLATFMYLLVLVGSILY
jgi:uncharacterized protein with PQ loop repeat